MNKRLMYFAVIVALLLALPGVYSLGERLVAKKHIQNGCQAFANDMGAKDSDNVSIFQEAFSKAALADPIYLPIAQASDLLDASLDIAFANNFGTEWRDALSKVQGLCWSYVPEE